MVKLVRSLFWSGLDTITALLVGLGSVVVIARLIGPVEFGLGSLALGLVLLVVIVISSLFHDALIQQPELDPLALDSAFTLSLLAAVAACLLLGTAAAPLARLLEEPRLAPVVWALLPTVLFGAAAMPLIGERRRALDFRLVGRKQLLSRVMGLAAGVGVAAAGGGVWSIVAQQLATTGILALDLLLTRPSWPRLRFAWAAAAPLLRFSRYIVWTQLLLQASERLFVFTIGYFAGLGAAGYWGVAARIVESLTGIVMQTLYHVALAHFARLQDDRERLAAALDESLDLLLLVVLPLLVAVVAGIEPLLLLLLGPAWLPAAPIVLWMLLGALLMLRRLLVSVALNALGRPEAGFAATAAESAAGAVAVLALGKLGVVAIAAVRGLAPVVGWLVLTRQAARGLRRPAWQEAGGLCLDLAIVAAALAAVQALTPLLAAEPPLVRLAADAALGFGVSFALLALVRPRAPLAVLGQIRLALAEGRPR